MTWVDHIVSVFMDPKVTDVTIESMVNGEIDDRPDTWYTNESVFGRSNRDRLLQAIGDLDKRNGDTLEMEFVRAATIPNILSQKTSMLLMTFVRAALTGDDLGVSAETMGLSDGEGDRIEAMRQRLLDAFRKKIEDHSFVEEDEVIAEYFGSVSQTGHTLQTAPGGVQEDFICKNFSTNQINQIMRINFGSSGLGLLYDRERSRFLDKTELCSKIRSKISAFEKLVVNSQFLTRKAIFGIKYGLMLIRGFYYMIDRAYQKVTKRNSTAEFLVALVAVFRVVNPLAVTYRVVSATLLHGSSAAIAAGPQFVFGLVVMLLVIYLQYGMASGLAYESAVQVGDHGLGPIPDAHQPFREPDKNPGEFGKQNRDEVMSQLDVMLKAQAAVDQRISTLLKQFRSTATNWDEDKKLLPADFRVICASLDTGMTTEQFMDRFYNDQTLVSSWADYLDRRLASVPQRFFAALKPSLTLDDIFDAKGAKRSPAEICVAVYVRISTEQKPIFTNFVNTYAPVISS